MNSTAISEWLSNQNNMNTVNIVQQAISLFFGVLIFIKSYDFESCLKSVRNKREQAKREKERKKLEKFKKLLELSKSGDLDLDKLNLSGNDNDTEESETKVPDSVMKVARKKSRSRDREVV